MIGYFDTSAFVPLLISEPTSGLCRRLWDDADAVVTTRLSYVEAAAALAQALRLARLTKQSYRAAMRILDRLWDEFEVVDVDDRIVRRAAQLAYTCALRGDDAVHCASAEQLSDGDLVVATGDRKLLDACISLGIATADVTNPAPAD
ncbi:MAG: type II toxin-antitoxin system VapC family toxin [Pseudonocardiaceae bacterium]